MGSDCCNSWSLHICYLYYYLDADGQSQTLVNRLKHSKSSQYKSALSDRENKHDFYINASKTKKISSNIILTPGKILNIVLFLFAIHGVDNVFCLFV